jgi:hypothetical protein
MPTAMQFASDEQVNMPRVPLMDAVWLSVHVDPAMVHT